MGRKSRHINQPAGTVAPFKKRDLMALAGGSQSGFHAGYASSYYDDIFRPSHRAAGHLLKSYRGIDRAAQRFALRNVPYAAFIAAQAWLHRSFPAGCQFLRQRRIRNKSPSHGDKISLAGPQHLFSSLSVMNAARHRHKGSRAAQSGSDRLRRSGVPAHGQSRRRPGKTVGLYHARAHMNQIDAALHHFSGDLHRQREPDAALNEFIGTQPERNRKIRPESPAYAFYDHFGETHALFKAAPPFISTTVGEGREERTDQITMGSMHFNHIESGGRRPFGRGRKAAGQPFYLLAVQHSGIF